MEILAYTVKYQYLAPMLLNEFQKQHSLLAAQQELVKAQQQEIDTLRGENAKMQQRLDRLERLLAQPMSSQ